MMEVEDITFPAYLILPVTDKLSTVKERLHFHLANFLEYLTRLMQRT